MDKVLTIAVCAYNMEQYIQKALESCLIEDLDKIEVLIMNDGSTDQTAEIAEMFCKKYSNSFLLINKENGGWGSNINEAVRIGRGKYFKVLDADDWFDIENLQRFIKLLDKIDVDMVTSLYVHCNGENRKIHSMEWEKYVGKKMLLESIEEYVHLSIWGVTFRLQLLKEHLTDLPEHTLYTDTLLIVKALAYVEYVWFCDIVLYNYRIGRTGQSMSSASIKRHYPEQIFVLNEEIDYYLMFNGGCRNRIHIFNRIALTYMDIIENLLNICGDKTIDVTRVMRDCEIGVKHKIPELYEKVGKRKFIKVLRLTNYKTVRLVNWLLKMKHR